MEISILANPLILVKISNTNSSPPPKESHMPNIDMVLNVDGNRIRAFSADFELAGGGFSRGPGPCNLLLFYLVRLARVELQRN